MSNGACYFGSTLPFHLWCKQAALLRGQWCVDMPEKLNLITINQVFVSLLTSCCWTIGGRKLLILTGKFPPRFWRRGRHDLMSLIPEVCVWPIQLHHCYVWEQALETGLNCSPDAAINIQARMKLPVKPQLMFFMSPFVYWINTIQLPEQMLAVCNRHV